MVAIGSVGSIDDDASPTVADEARTVDARPTRRASEPLVPGERYQLGATIGRGGMGEVVAAQDLQIGRDVAIKRLTAPAPTRAQLARFFREARIQGRLEHPAIPPVHELAVDDDGRPYFVMKKLAGVTLADVLRDPAAHPSFTRQRLVRAFVDVCHAIELAHARGIIHRDLKPGNVLLGEHGEVYVIDWGIARELDGAEPFPGAVAGTPGYMPPEQARGDADVDARVDVFALGCVLYEILTGAPLHRPSARAARDDVPPELDLAWRRATEPDRDQRTASVRELAEILQRHLDGDRDHVRRAELARRHLAVAGEALARLGNGEAGRSVAMREAGRALALDPTLAPAAELVGRLMIAPPPETPREVTDEIDAIGRERDRKHLRAILLSGVVYLLFVPLLVAFGIRDVGYLTALATMMVVNMLVQTCAIRSDRFMRVGGPFAAVTGIAMLVLVARMWTPFALAPSFAMVSIMSSAMSSQMRDRRVFLALAGVATAVILGWWGAEELGLVSRTMFVVDGALVLRPPLDGIANAPLLPMMALYIVTTLWSAAMIAWAVSRMRDVATERLQVQAWQLRQLL